MSVFLLECREDEERQANFLRGFFTHLETMASFTDDAILTEI